MADEPNRPPRQARRKQVWAFLPAAAIATAAATALIATEVSGPSEHHQPPTLIGAHPVAQLLSPYASCDALLDGLRSHASAHLSAFMSVYATADNAGGGLAGGVVNAPMAAAGSEKSAAYSAGSGASSQTSTTNVQEAGVDEPDTVKTDGNRVITVAGGSLRVIDPASHQVSGTLDLRKYANADGAELLVDGNSAVVLLKAAQSVIYGGPMIVPDSPGGGRVGPVPAQNQGSTVLYVDLSGAPHVTGSLEVSGSILDARMVGSTVRVVASNSPIVARPQTYKSDSQYKSALRSAINRTPLESWLPSYTVTDASGAARTSAVPCRSVERPTDFTAASMVTVYTVDPSKPGADPQPVSVSADGNTVYATTTSLYVTSSPYCMWCFGANGRTSTTEIHRFDITGANKPTYIGSGAVEGSLLSQYSLSDYAGSLRVATTIIDSKGKTVSGVDVLDATTLKQIGSVSGLGRGERVYAVRFLGKLGYVVTYNQQDPLYVLDLSDARAPRLVGSLEIPGFSSYLHDAGNGRLIGVGQDTTLVDESGGQYAHNEGRMVQLFDVSDPSRPTRTAKIVLPDTGTPGDPSFDPHAFLYWQPTGLVVVPISNQVYGSANGGALAVRLDGSRLAELGTVTNHGDDSQPSAIQRSLIVDGNLWTFSDLGVEVSNQADLAPIAWIGYA